MLWSSLLHLNTSDFKRIIPHLKKKAWKGSRKIHLPHPSRSECGIPASFWHGSIY